MTDINDILNRKVSFQKSAFAPLSNELVIKEVLRGIKEERLSNIVLMLRGFLNRGDYEYYGQQKKRLPGVTFSATFHERRRRSDLKKYNGIIVIDIDKLTENQLDEYKKELLSDKYVISFWESPSKKGLKGLVGIDYFVEFTDFDLIHRIAFKKLVDYFQNNYKIELDESGSDTTRLCFLSSDVNLVVKEECCLFPVTSEDLEKYSIIVKDLSIKKGRATLSLNKKDALFNPKGKNLPQNRLVIKSIIIYLTKRRLSITSTYDKWYRVGFAIANSFTHDIGERYFLDFCQLDGIKHNEIESKNLLINCYETTNSEISFSTIYHLAQGHGYKPKKNKGDGSEDV